MLPLNDKFSRDIKGNNTSLYPLIVIDDEYYISTVEESIKDGDNVLNFKDYNLKISNIKESIDIKNHNFKISNVTLTLNNYELNRIRLSDNFKEKINTFAVIYYKSQSCKILDDCLQIYRGQIKKFDHDDKTIRIILEDLTETTLHKDIPISNLGTSNCYSKDFLNRYIPITYGYVEKAPAIPYLHGNLLNDTGERKVSIISDDIGVLTGNDRNIEITGFGTKETIPEDSYLIEGNNPFYIYKGGYQKVLRNAKLSIIEPDINGAVFYQSPKQYEIDESSNFIDLIKEFTGQFAQNPTAFNELQTVKIRFPNECKLLFSADDEEIPDSQNFSIINVEPPTGILNPEGSYDNPNMQHSNILNSSNSHSTFTQIPNNSINISNTDVSIVDAKVHEFTPFWDDETSYHSGIKYSKHADQSNRDHFLYTVNAWCQTNAAHLPVQFIDMPTPSVLRGKVRSNLIQNGMNPLYLNQAHTEMLLQCQTSNPNLITNPVNVTPACLEITTLFQNAWLSACNLTGDEQTQQLPGLFINFKNQNYRYSSYNNNSFHYNMIDLFQGDYNGANNPMYFPQNIFIFKFRQEQNPLIALVGMYNSTTMPPLGNLPANCVWYNIFADDNLDIPYLYEYTDRCIYTPTDEIARRWTGTDKLGIGVKFEAFWNCVSIQHLDPTSFEHVVNEPYLGGIESLNQRQLWNEASGTGSYGGNSWFIRITDDIPMGSVLTEVEGTDIDGEYPYTVNNKMHIKKDTMMPCNSIQRYSVGTGHPYPQSQFIGHDYVLPDLTEHVPLTVGSNAIAERRLSLLYPLESSGSNDALVSTTYAFGKLNCTFSDEFSLDTDDKFVVSFSATDMLSGDSNFNALEPLGETNIINLSGNSTFISETKEILWSSSSSDENNPLNNEFDFNFSNYKINNWTKPDTFDSIALTYRVKGVDTDNFLGIQTNIYSISILQYTIFENALNDEFYLDTIGRANLPEDVISDDLGNIKTKYTNETPSEDKLVIQNPADVIYHLLEKELQGTDKMNRDSWIEARNNNLSIDIALSVKDKINSKKLIQEISKNSMSYPKYDSYGNFSFSNIKSEYGNSDYEVKSEDIISYNFKKTPIEDILTLVNVKFKKDYAEDEYLKSTGYCDAYDFFGNGDLNGLIKQDGSIESGYSYSYHSINREHKILEFESDYIRDLQSAIILRNYLFLQNCNQHTLMSLTLPIKYMFLESGDIISFDSLINNLKAYGEDYTSNEVIRNGQVIYPFFIITSITKSTKSIKIECMQLHKLTSEADFSDCKGSITRSSELGINSANTPSEINTQDLVELYNFIQSKSKYFTTLQKNIADVTINGIIDTYDLNILETALGYATGQTTSEGAFEYGDVNMDGTVNVVDIVAMVSYILNTELEISDLADINTDGVINVVDVVALVSNILGE